MVNYRSTKSPIVHVALLHRDRFAILLLHLATVVIERVLVPVVLAHLLDEKRIIFHGVAWRAYRVLVDLSDARERAAILLGILLHLFDDGC